MIIESVSISNFKSFRDCRVKLGELNILIGANASGKSNFIQVIKFLRDISSSGLHNAISLQGGVKYLRNMNIGLSAPLVIEIAYRPEVSFVVRRETEGMVQVIKITKAIYKVDIGFDRSRRGFKIREDVFTQECDVVQYQEKGSKLVEKGKIGTGKIVISNLQGRIHLKLEFPESLKIRHDDIMPPFFKEEKLPQDSVLLQSAFPFAPFLKSVFAYVSIYNFEPKLTQKATPITGKAELDEDGGNLSIILRNIIERKGDKRKLCNLMRELLPFISDLDVDRFADKSLLFKLKEKYFPKEYLPASLISEGTINITALIIALYFDEHKPISIIEEPERNIHPFLIGRVVHLMKDASRKKQIIVTTHNPEMVKHSDLENILLVSRDELGFSTIYRPAKKAMVQAFLKNEIGIDEIYVQDLFGD